MPTATPRYLSLLDEDLYRLGSATSPKLHHARPGKDIGTYERNGIVMVRANGQGISLITEDRFERERTRHTGCYLWKLPANFPMPSGLALVPDIRDLRPGQEPDPLPLCPQSDMPFSEYVALLSELALKLERVQKV
jgi:hypothetical protein